jgi:Coenzyme F420-dependent N5,N10-methylene tetrahydromethanopterin reductase and related flavin-dependent oxidoreductases
LLAAIGAKSIKIEIGTGVIDMLYENPLYMVEDAGAADLISGGRLHYFDYEPSGSEDDATMGRHKALVFSGQTKRRWICTA